MNLSDIIEEHIRKEIEEQEFVELSRNKIAELFNCVPSQINYVISTRFSPELGFYVESRRGGGGYIKISRVDLTKSDYISYLISKIGNKMSQSVVDIYLKELLRYNIIDQKNAIIMKSALSDKSLIQISPIDRDLVRSNIFKNIIIKLI